MTAVHLSTVSVPEDRACDLCKGARLGITALIDMQVHIEPALGCEAKQAVELGIEQCRVGVVLDASGNATEYPARTSDQIGQHQAFFPVIDLHRHEGRRLQRDPASPPIADIAEHLERNGCLAGHQAVEVRADRGCTVCVGATQGEVEARRDVRRAPVGKCVKTRTASSLSSQRKS
jgi:hypothetical protein